MPDDPVLARYCGACANHRPDTQTCAAGMSYAAFVMLDTPANGCTGYTDKGRAEAEQQMQSQARGPMPAGVGIFQYWSGPPDGVKP